MAMAKTTAAYNGLLPLASVRVSINFVVGWLTDILNILHHDDCPANPFEWATIQLSGPLK